MSTEYNDDRPGMMRVHIADQRGRLAAYRFKRDTLRAHAKGHACPTPALKSDLAWYMAQHGLIDDEGYLRDGFPEATP